MKTSSLSGFTLSEMLIALTVLGALAALILPGLIKDSTSKAQIGLVQTTVGIINTAVQTEIINKRATTIKDTDIYNNPLTFLKTMDVAKTTSGACAGNGFFPTMYKNVSGENVGYPTCDAAAILKNGAVIGIKNSYQNQNVSAIALDINGDKDPNIIGVDYFDLELAWETDYTSGKHLGDIGGSSFNNTTSTDNNFGNLKAKCKTGGSAACYYALEQSGFDYNYLK